jgi:YVTN family beta-propeller protein
MSRANLISIQPILVLSALLSGVISLFGVEVNSAPTLDTQLRRPVALITQPDYLLVGNRRSGTITMLDTSSGGVVAEHSVARRIADMAELPNGAILVLDDVGQQLWKVALSRSRVAIDSIARVPTDASKLAVSADGRQVFVTARWSHQVVALDLEKDFEHVTQTRSISLPFAPRELLLVKNDKALLAADAFAGKLAIVDAVQKKLLRVRKLKGHNIRGLAVGDDGAQLFVAHQQMVHKALADFEELHWGRMVTNAVQVFDLKEVLTGETEQIASGWLNAQGGIGGATADPSGVVTGPDDLMAVAFSGVGEVVVRKRGSEKRITVNAGAEAMAIGPDQLYVANRFDDSVSIIDLARGEVVRTVALGPAPESSDVDRGEKLFFDARLSHEGWISCHSCHTDGHSSGLIVDTLGDGDYGAAKRVPSLLGTRDTGPWSWNGRIKSLADQVRKSVTTTMHGESLTDEQISDLVAYLESLQPPPPADQENRELTRRGRLLFGSRGCSDCHVAPTFTSPDTYDVNLTDERKRTSFNPPSLLGVSQRQHFFHDGRAASLEDVLIRYRHALDDPLSKEEAAALLAYLRSR